MSFEQDVRTMLRERAEGVAVAPVVPERTMRRVRVRKALMAGGVAVAVAAVAVAGAFMRSAIWTDAAPVPPASNPSPTPTIQDVWTLPTLAPLDSGTYYIEPDGPSTSLRVVYDVSADGWSQWFGAVKFAKDGHVGVSIASVTNLVRHGCRNHSPADPPVGPSVDDLATALADLAPFRVTSAPKDVTIYGYRGKHLELTVPNMPTKGRGDDRRFTGCVDGNLKSWIAPISSAFYGYNAPGHTEEFWILDVDGTRLMIEANWSLDSPQEDVAEMRAILDSIRIEP